MGWYFFNTINRQFLDFAKLVHGNGSKRAFPVKEQVSLDILKAVIPFCKGQLFRQKKYGKDSADGKKRTCGKDG